MPAATRGEVNRTGRREWLVGLGGAALTFGLSAPAAGQRLRDRVSAGVGKMTSVLPNTGFSVDGRRGVFLQQIAGRPYPTGPKEGDGSGLGGPSILDKGDAQPYRLPVDAVEKQVKAFIAPIDGMLPNREKQTLQIILTGLMEYSPKALPDGSVVLHIGTFDRVETDDELAFILAHEISHVRLGHYMASGAFVRGRQMARTLAQAYTGATALSEQKLVSQGDTTKVITQDQARVERSARRAAANSGYVNTMLNVLAEPLWSRAQEDEADALAYDITLACKYSPDPAAEKVFTKVPLEFEARKRALEAAQNQFASLTAIALDEKTGVFSGEGEALRQRMVNDLKTGLRDKVFSMATDFFQQKHRTPKARREGVGKYSLAAYPAGVPQRDEVSPWLASLRKNPAYIQAITAAKSVAAAEAARRDENPEEALRAIQPALSSTLKSTPFVANAAAQVYDDNHNVARADQLYTTAHLSPDQTVDGYIKHVEMLVRSARYDKARTIIAQAEKRFGDEKPFIAKKIAIDMRTGKNDAAIANLQKCTAYGRSELSNDCARAMLDERLPDLYKKMKPEQQAKVDRELAAISNQAAVIPNVKGMLDGLGGLFGKAE